MEPRAEVRIEKRKFKRLVVKERAFVAFRPEFTKLGRIKDISRNGLGCEYLVFKAVDEDPGISEIDIFLSGNKFYMSRVQCKVVYDILMDNYQGEFAKTIDYRRCGLQLGKLRAEQREQLEFFLEKHVGMSS